MTSQAKRNETKFGTARSILLSAILTAAVFMSAIYLSDELGGYVEDALLLSVRIIIPSIFPFLVLTDIITPYLRFEIITPLRTLFEKTFKINGTAIPIYMCGILCGFPIGAKMAYDAYRRGCLSRDECERLMAFANNAGPGYVISAVGASIRGSVKEGVLLYLSMVASSAITGFIVGINRDKSEYKTFNIEQKYNFIESVRSAAVISINVCAFISTFGIFVGLTKTIIRNEYLSALFVSVLEMGNAALYLASPDLFSPLISLILTSFAISFSGLSVIFQTLSIQEKGVRIDAKAYVTRKLLQGIIAAILTTLFYILFIN